MKTLTRIALVLLTLTAVVPVLAQDARGRVQGTIIDKNGADVPGATLTLRNDATGIAVTSQSGENGRYLFNQIDPGIYTITVQQRGFKTVVQKNIQLHSRGDVTADITLEVSDIAETVTIESGAANVQFNTTITLAATRTGTRSATGRRASIPGTISGTAAAPLACPLSRTSCSCFPLTRNRQTPRFAL